MFIIFGWEKTVKPVESILKTHCYHCNNNSKWTIFKETEWASLFFVNIIPLTNKYHLSCEICGDATQLSTADAKKALNPETRSQQLHDRLIQIIEDSQFDGYSASQINYRKAKKDGQQF